MLSLVSLAELETWLLTLGFYTKVFLQTLLRLRQLSISNLLELAQFTSEGHFVLAQNRQRKPKKTVSLFSYRPD